MYWKDRIVGHTVSLTSVTEDDADFLLGLRNDPQVCTYLPPLHISVEQQKEWIRQQRADETSYYFLVRDKLTSRPIGSISVYDISGDHSEAGRTAIIGSPVQNSEAVLLLYHFAFSTLELAYTTCWVIAENTGVYSLNKRIGYVFSEKGITEDNRRFYAGRLTAESFRAAYMRYYPIIQATAYQ